jgi:hypothetical protein
MHNISVIEDLDTNCNQFIVLSCVIGGGRSQLYKTVHSVHSLLKASSQTMARHSKLLGQLGLSSHLPLCP